MWPITFNTTFVNLIHAITAKNLGTHISNLVLCSPCIGWILLFPICGCIDFRTLMLVNVSSKKICL